MNISEPAAVQLARILEGDGRYLARCQSRAVGANWRRWLPYLHRRTEAEGRGVGARYSAPLPAADRLDLGGIGEKISAFDDDRPIQKHPADRGRVRVEAVAA
jgi:hypothetical protein